MTDQKKLEKLFKQHYRQMYRLATILLQQSDSGRRVPVSLNFAQKYFHQGFSKSIFVCIKSV